MSPMTLVQLKARMKDNPEFQGFIQQQERMTGSKLDSDEALVRAYQTYIIGLLSDVQGQLTDPSSLRISLVLSLSFNKVFQQDFKAGNPTLAQRYEKETRTLTSGPVNELMSQVLRQYLAWLTAELDEVMLKLEEVGVDTVLQYEKRRALEMRFGSLFERELRMAREEGYTLQYATQEKEQTKKEVMAFLTSDSSSPVTRFNYALFGKTDKTTAGIDLLNREITRCQRRIEELRGVLPRYAKQKDSQEIIKGQIASLESRIMEANTYIERLRTSKAFKKEARESWQSKTGEAEAFLKSTDTEFLRMSKDLIQGVSTVSVSLREQEERIGILKKEMEQIIDKIPRLYGEQDMEMKELQRIESIVSGDPIRLKLFASLGIKIPDPQPLRQSIARRAQEIQQTDLRHRVLTEDLSFLDAKYNAMFDRTQEALEDQENLNRMRARAKDELKWLQGLDKVDKALNVYCSTATVTFDLFLSIGMIAAGKACGPIGATAVMGMGFATAPLSAGLSLPVSAGLLASIEPYDTGQFGISLKLGISWGADFKLATKDSLELNVGLALVYDASIELSDTRTFKTVCTLTLQATAKASIPKALEVALTMELIKEKTAMAFKDVHQWAAWLGQKWANARAWVSANRLYEGGGRFDQPTVEDLKRLREVAEISLMNDKQTREMLEKVFQYMSEPITRTECKELFSGIEAEASAAEFFTLKGSLEKTADPKYLRRGSDPKTGDVWEEEREGKQVSRSLGVGVGIEVDMQYSNVSADPNPDNEGQSLTFTISLPMFDQNAQWVAKPGVDPSGGAIGNWVSTHIAPVAEKIGSITSPGVFNLFKNPLAENALLTFGTSLSLGTIEVCLFLSKITSVSTPNSKWVLLYWRPIFSTSTSIEKSVPLGYGFNLVLGGTISLKRTYREQIGDNTIIYLQIVYDGLMNISPPGDDNNPRPVEARGPALWKTYVDAHKKTIWRMMHNLTVSDAWIAAEVKERSGGPGLITSLKSIMPAPPRRTPKVLPSQLKSNYVDTGEQYFPDFNQTVFDRGLKLLEAQLEEFRKGDYTTHKNKDWKRVEITGGTFNWSINPYKIAKEIVRTHSTQYQLEKGVLTGTTVLGHRKGLSEQIMADVKWVPDEEAPTCMLCHTSFGVFTRRHHCRECGKVFCAKCCSHTMALPHRGLYDKERVCNTCYDRLTAKPKQTVQAQSSHKAPTLSGQGNLLSSGQSGVSVPQQSLLTSTKVSVPQKESLLTSTKVNVPQKDSLLGHGSVGLGGQGQLGGEDEVTLLAGQAHQTWWSTKINQPVPSRRDLQGYIDFVSGDVQQAQLLSQKGEKSGSSSKSKVSQEKGIKVSQERTDPAVGRELTTVFDVTDVSGDGNCLFRSVAVALGKSEAVHEAYRRLAVEHLYRHQVDFRQVYETNFLAYLYTMSQKAVGPMDKPRWGSSPEIMALSRIFKREIVVYACKFESPDPYTLDRSILYVAKHAMGEGEFKPPQESTPLLIAHQGGNHYVCLRRR
ncbi:MAG: FYVE zinc finger domain-containing protein [Syntrophobacteraceae bacterium]